MRTAEIKRKTNETDIELNINLDGQGSADVKSGSGFLDHMLTLFAKHGKFDLAVRCVGDTEVDLHHTTEDIGICLGLAFREALGNKAGIVRYADTILPMDEALILTALDISGRGYFACELNIKADKVGDFDTELASEFWQAFAINAGCTLHIRQLAGSNAHHIIEGVFKSAARSLRRASEIDARFKDDIPSTKGTLA
ncbi:MAG: imidazoleglycerol-phosphate dehydratase HisB [Ruminococcaceae bacterium]|nr:imidazoleglycerol-phosphate dehydratase HisB [Oscillospiraceae bacterium]